MAYDIRPKYTPPMGSITRGRNGRAASDPLIAQRAQEQSVPWSLGLQRSMKIEQFARERANQELRDRIQRQKAISSALQPPQVPAPIDPVAKKRANLIAGGAQPMEADRIIAQEAAQAQQPAVKPAVAQAAKPAAPVAAAPMPAPALGKEADINSMSRGYRNAADEINQNRQAGAEGVAVRPMPLLPSQQSVTPDDTVKPFVEGPDAQRNDALRALRDNMMTAGRQPAAPPSMPQQQPKQDWRTVGGTSDDIAKAAKRASITKAVDDKYANGYEGLPEADQKKLLAAGYDPTVKPEPRAMGGPVQATTADPLIGNANAASPVGLGGVTTVGAAAPRRAPVGGATESRVGFSAAAGGGGDGPTWGKPKRPGPEQVQQLAKGGKAKGGKTYLVGEKGPEMFMPKDKGTPEVIGKNGPEVGNFAQDGTVVPNHALHQMADKFAKSKTGDKKPKNAKNAKDKPSPKIPAAPAPKVKINWLQSLQNAVVKHDMSKALKSPFLK